MAAQVAQSLELLSKTNAKLDRMLAKIGSKADNAEFREGMTRERNNAKKICASIMAGLRQCDKEAVEKYNSQIKSEFEKFKQISIAIESKDKQIVDIMHSHQAPDSNDGPNTALLPQSFDRMQFLQELEIQVSEVDAEEIRRREEGIRALEQDMKEVAEIFQDFAHLVNEQQAPLDVIEGNLGGAKNKTAGAHEQLRQAEEMQKKSRKKNCCVLFLVLALVGAVSLGIILW